MSKKKLTSKWQSEENISLAHYLYKSVEDEISDSFYTEAIIHHEYPFTPMDVEFLQKMTEANNALTEKMGQYYSKKINLLSQHGTSVLRNFWHDELLKTIFQSELPKHSIAAILELHNKHWSQSIETRKTVYDSLSRVFDYEFTITHPNLHPVTWTNLVKIMAISRDEKIIEYLIPFLNDTTTFIQTNRYTNEPVGTASSARKRNPPIKLNTRKCDVAFVALLRALNQVEYIPNNY